MTTKQIAALEKTACVFDVETQEILFRFNPKHIDYGMAVLFVATLEGNDPLDYDVLNKGRLVTWVLPTTQNLVDVVIARTRN
jgi:hypothetical protein